MPTLILDSGAVTFLSQRNQQSLEMIEELKREGFWPPVVLTVTLAECISGRPHTDAVTHRLLKTCTIREDLPRQTAERAGALRRYWKGASAADAIVVAAAEPGASVLTGDLKDLLSLADHARDVRVRPIHTGRLRRR